MATTTANGVNGTNGHNSTRTPRTLKPGISVPSLTFFHENEDLDLDTLSTHCLRLAKGGLTSITLLGSNGEAVHVLPAERGQITSHIRSTLDSNGFPDLPLIIGCSAPSVRETVSHCQTAYDAGADYAIILPPSYFRPAMTDAAVTSYFLGVADKSPIGIVVYNYPGAVAGVDLSSDVISTLAKHPKIIGCKLTCGNTGKLARIASSTKASTYANPSEQGFMCMGGSADFTLQTLIAGGSGIITGLGNINPKTCVHLYNLYAEGKVAEAQRLQAIVAKADWAVIQGGVPGTKAACEWAWGYGGVPRRPLSKCSKEETEKWGDMVREAMEWEKRL